MLCWSLSCCLTVVSTNHSRHVISRLPCNFCKKACCSTEDSHGFVQAHVTLCHPVSVGASCKTRGHSFSNEACVRQWLQHTAVFDWCKRSKTVRAAPRIWHALVIHPTLQTQTHTHTKAHQMVQCYHHAMLNHIGAHPDISVECVHYITMQVLVYWFQHYACLSVQMMNKLTWISAAVWKRGR